MRRQLIVFAFGFISCSEPIKEKQEPEKLITSGTSMIGERIQGDFNGDGRTEFATATLVKKGQGNPVEDGSPDEYEIQFSDLLFEAIKADCCEIRLINEGDLNNDRADEISLFQAPMNGCTYSMSTFSFSKGKWNHLIQPFLIPTGCDNIGDDDLQNRIFKENNAIYFYDTDLDDETGKLTRKKAIAN